MKYSSLAFIASTYLLTENTLAVKYNTSDYVAIPPGESPQNAAGFDLKGTFSSIRTDKGKLQFELQMSLTSPVQIDD